MDGSHASVGGTGCRWHRWLFVALGLTLAASRSGRAAASADAMPPTSLAARLQHADHIRTSDHQRFLALLAQLHRNEAGLSSAERWQLDFLDAWQSAFAGHPGRAEKTLRRIVDQAPEPALTVRASALLINVLSRSGDYRQAYRRANDLTARLGRMHDPRARTFALREIIQMMALAGQEQAALKYVKLLRDEPVTGDDRCTNASYEINALYDAGKVSAASPQLTDAINACLAAGQPVYANTLRLDRADLLAEAGQTRRAIALMQRITPSILHVGFQPHIASLHADLAGMYLQQGDLEQARAAARRALASAGHSHYSWPLQSAYHVLYQVARRRGDSSAALSYYRQYVAQAHIADQHSRARALAYQEVRQDVLAKQLHLDRLRRENRILQLHQALEHKATETARLHVVILLLAIALIGVWLYRLKHSQLHFRRLARHDGLTGAFNRQHFFDSAGQVLQRLRRTGATACLVLLDLDHFKRVNDTYGHVAGDEVLRHVTSVCGRELRNSDVFGRLGGEEFGILMPGCSRQQGVEIAHRIRRALAAAPLRLDASAAVTVSASFGLACSDSSGYVLKQLFSDADAALYRAKRGGRNRLIVDDEASSSTAEA